MLRVVVEQEHVEQGAMPRRLPPIAPPAPSGRPVASPDAPIQNHNHNPLVVADEDHARLVALDQDPRRFLTEPNPFSRAIWLSLQRTPADVLARDVATKREAMAAEQLPPQSDEPGEAPVLPSFTGPPRSALIAVADALVASALRGSHAAQMQIANRIEGSPGIRRADIDPEAQANRERVRATIEMIVRDMAERAERRDLDVTSVTDVDPEPER